MYYKVNSQVERAGRRTPWFPGATARVPELSKINNIHLIPYCFNKII